MLKENILKEKILSGEKVVGAFLNLESPAIAEILGLIGFDFILIDTEHGAGDVEATQHMIRAAESRGIEPFVRVKQIERASILKMIDIGATGLLIPNIKTLEEVRAIVKYAKYRPIGEKGYGLSRRGGYGFTAADSKTLEDYFRWANQNTLVIPQCETVESLDNIEEIVNIDGVDGIFFGPYDLSISMGIPAQMEHPDFKAAMKRVIKACKKANKFCFTISFTSEQAKEYFTEGFDGVVSADINFLVNGASSYLSAIKDANESHT